MRLVVLVLLVTASGGASAFSTVCYSSVEMPAKLQAEGREGETTHLQVCPGHFVGPGGSSDPGGGLHVPGPGDVPEVPTVPDPDAPAPPGPGAPAPPVPGVPVPDPAALPPAGGALEPAPRPAPDGSARPHPPVPAVDLDVALPALPDLAVPKLPGAAVPQAPTVSLPAIGGAYEAGARHVTSFGGSAAPGGGAAGGPRTTGSSLVPPADDGVRTEGLGGVEASLVPASGPVTVPESGLRTSPVAAVGAALAWAALALYRRLAAPRVLDNAVRRRILDHVLVHPGTTCAEAARVAGVHYVTADRHLATLAEFGHVAVLREADGPRYFENHGRYGHEAQRVLSRLRRRENVEFLAAVARMPGTGVIRLADALGIAKSTASRRAALLRDAGLLVPHEGGFTLTERAQAGLPAVSGR